MSGGQYNRGCGQYFIPTIQLYLISIAANSKTMHCWKGFSSICLLVVATDIYLETSAQFWHQRHIVLVFQNHTVAFLLLFCPKILGLSFCVSCDGSGVAFFSCLGDGRKIMNLKFERYPGSMIVYKLNNEYSTCCLSPLLSD